MVVAHGSGGRVTVHARSPEMAVKTPETASETVREAIRDSGLPIREIARRTGVEVAGLSRFMNGLVGISLTTFERLASELGLRVVRTRRKPAPAPGGRAGSAKAKSKG